MFGKKKKAAAADAAQEPKQEPKKQPSVKGKKRDNVLYQLFHESVYEAVLPQLKKNDQFVRVDENGQPEYIALALHLDSIGGFDKKSKKDEAKGTIIEQINSGHICSYVTKELLDEGLIVIVPEPQTLGCMDEFSLLTNASYELCRLTETGDIDLLGIPVTYDQIADLVVSDGRVDSLLPGGQMPEASEEEDDDIIEDVPTESTDEITEMPMEEEALEEIPDYMAQPEETPVDDDIEPEPEDEVPYDKVSVSLEEPDSDTVFLGTPDADALPEPDLPPAEETLADGPEEEMIAPELTFDAVVRRFYGDDLGLEVTTEPFDLQFMKDNDFVPFDEKRPEGWLNEQLNEMAKAANHEMREFHRNNLFLLRERYFKLLSMQCDRIQKDLDIHTPESAYGQMYQQLVDVRQQNLSDMNDTVSKRRDELEANWHQKLQEVGLNAAREAQQQYRERYGARHEEQMDGVYNIVKASIEADFADQQQDLHDRRREEASTLLDLAINEVLDEISEMYLQMVEEERTRYGALQEQMQQFIQEHQQEDIVRAKVLEEELRQNDRAKKAYEEQEARIETLTKDYSAKREELLEELNRLREENRQRIADCEADAERRVQRAEAETEDAKQRLRDLMEQYATLDEKKSKEYEKRMSEKDDEISAWKSRMTYTEEAHKRSNVMGAFLVVAIAIATLSIGVILGSVFSSSQYAAQLQMLTTEETGD